MSLDFDYVYESEGMSSRFLSPSPTNKHNIDDGWAKVLDFERKRAAAIEKKVKMSDQKVEEIELPQIVINSPTNTARGIKKQISLDGRVAPRKMVRHVKVGAMPEENNSISSGTRGNHPNHNHNHHHHEHTNSVAQFLHLPHHHRDNWHTEELLSKFTKEELDEFHQLFSLFDTDGSGAIGSEELKEAIMSIGLQANDAEIDRLIKEVDEDGNGEIDFAEFCECMKKSQNLAKSTNEEIIKQCFEIFDQDHNGMITENEFKYIAKEIGGFSDELAEHVFNELDISSNGYLSVDQFAAIVEDYLLSDPYRF